MNPRVRSDLRYAPDPDDETRFIVKDPLRATFHRFNALQVAMMQKLDGRRTFEEIAEEIGEELGSEVSPDSMDRFIVRLQNNFLFEVSSYRSDPSVHRKVRRIFARKGIEPSAQQSEERQLMEEGLRRVRDGDPCLAASWFAAVLELNPSNAEARVALDTIHDVFFRQQRFIQNHTYIFPLWNPDGFLTWIDRKFGRFIFSPLAVALCLVATLIAAHAAVDIRPPPIDAVDLFVAYFSGVTLGILLHELSHGLACKHYGGKVDEVGLMMMYGVSWAAYCDVSDSYFFKNKRHKIITSMAGPMETAMHVVAMVIYLHLTPEGFPLRGVAFVRMFIGLYALFNNLIPLVKYDTYYALSEWLEIPNLRERSFRYLAVVLQDKLLGISADDPKPTPRERIIFLFYSVSAGIFTVLFVVGVVIHTLIPLAEEYLGTLGVVLMTLYVLTALKNMVVEPLIGFARFLWRNRRQLNTWRPAAVLAAWFVLLTAMLYPWPLLIDGEARFEPASRAAVYAKTSGIIQSIAVHEGMQVKRGDVLARLYDHDLELERARASEQLTLAELRLDLFRRGTRDEELQVGLARLEGARLASALERRIAARSAALSKQGLESNADSELAMRRLAASFGEQSVAQHSLAELKAGRRAEDLAGAEALVSQLTARLEELDRRIDDQQVVAPIDGVVVAYRLAERLHDQLSQGELFCEVHDLDHVRIEVLLPAHEPTTDVVAGSAVVARAWGYPATELEAVVERVAPKSNDQQGRVVVKSAVIDTTGWTSGSTGHARIYGARRSLMYQLLVRPVVRFIGYETWRFWG